MRKVYSRLSAEERVRIDELRNREGLGVRQIALRIGRDKWIGNGVLDNSLEDESLLCEFVGAPVSGGGAESLVVGPPHIVVEVGAWLFQAGVAVPVYELLLQEPVGGFDHGVVARVALPRRRSSDAEHVERPVDSRVAEPAAPVRVEHLHPGQGEAERGERAQYQARVPGPPGGMAGDAPVRRVDEQAHVRPLAADAHVRQATGQVDARLAAVEPAAEDVREPGLVGPRPVRFGPSARVRARMPRSRMMSTTRLPDAVTPLRSRAALIFPAPQRSWLPRRTACTSPAMGSIRSASVCPAIQ